MFGKRVENCNGDPEKIPMIINLQDEKNETKMKGTTLREITIINLSSEDEICENQDSSQLLFFFKLSPHSNESLSSSSKRTAAAVFCIVVVLWEFQS